MEPSRPQATVEKSSLCLSLTRYVAYNVSGMPYEVDAYVADLNDNEQFSPFFVVLFPTERGLPGYLYSADVSGLTHEAAIDLALEAYAALHREALAGWRRRDKSS